MMSMWEFKELWDSVEADIQQKRDEGGAVIKLHPHGFIQVELSGRDRRLHIWDDDIPRTADINTLHDHVWDFRSTVLRGCLLNYVYAPYWNIGKSFRLWQASQDRHSEDRGGKVLEATDQYCDVVNCFIDRVEAGETYFFPAFSFHDSNALGLTATLFTKTKTYPGDPRILCLDGASPDGELPESVTDEWLWNKIDSVFDNRA